MELSRLQALDLLRKYNKDPFHLRHALTVEAVMGWFARELGYGADEEFAAQGAALSTIACFVVIPVLMLIL